MLAVQGAVLPGGHRGRAVPVGDVCVQLLLRQDAEAAPSCQLLRKANLHPAQQAAVRLQSQHAGVRPVVPGPQGVFPYN